jgi:CHAT domain
MTTENLKPVIFLAFANEQGDGSHYLRNLIDERSNVRDILKPLEARGVRVEPEPNTTLEFILDTFRTFRDQIPIFHYGGHADSYGLLLEAANRSNQEVLASGLAAFLKSQSGLKLVFLNGCSTQGQVLALRDAGVGAVIATLQEIDDDVARAFAVGFYKSLMTGATIQMAFDEAQAEIQTSRGIRTEGSKRKLYREDAKVETDRFPWMLKGTPEARAWSLADALNDPTFGLPDLPEDIELPQEPYRNLERFKREDALVFFGRGRDTVELLNAIAAKGPTASQVVLLYGQTGVGKSSVLEAGVLPRLERSHHVIYARRDPERRLLGTLEHELSSISGMSKDSIGTMWRAAEVKLQHPLVFILDQLDEAFPVSVTAGNNTSVGNLELEELLDALRVVFSSGEERPKGKIVLGFRMEVLAEVEDVLKRRGLNCTWKFLKSIERSGIIEAITGPAKHAKYNLTIEPNLPSVIADDLLADSESPIAPTLQILMDRLWKDATTKGDPVVTLEQYNALRRPGNLFKKFFEDKIKALENWRSEVVESGLLFDLLEYHTTLIGTAKQNKLEELKNWYQHRPDILELVEHAQRTERLLVGSATKDGPPATRLAHDTLAPLVREQFQISQRPGQRARRILENQFREQQGAQAISLLDEQSLNLIEQGVSGMRCFTPDERILVERSQTALVEVKGRRRIYWRTLGGAIWAAVCVGMLQVLLTLLFTYGGVPQIGAVFAIQGLYGLMLGAAQSWCMMFVQYRSHQIRSNSIFQHAVDIEQVSANMLPQTLKVIFGTLGFGLMYQVLTFISSIPLSLQMLEVGMICGLGISIALLESSRTAKIYLWLPWRLGLVISIFILAQFLLNKLQSPPLIFALSGDTEINLKSLINIGLAGAGIFVGIVLGWRWGDRVSIRV